MPTPCLVAMEDSLKAAQNCPDIPALYTWLKEAAVCLAELLNRLHKLFHELQARPSERVQSLHPVSRSATGCRGRPRQEVDLVFLREALCPGRKMTIVGICKALGISRSSLNRRMNELGIHKPPFAVLDDAELDSIINSFLLDHPTAGHSYVQGHLLSRRLRVQRDRVAARLRRINGVRTTLQNKVTAKKKKVEYVISRPHALWHIDGHHKLILWGIVIHCVVDGYTRLVMGIQATNNNQADTMLAMFLRAIEEYPMPSRVRGDRGGENRDVSILMILLRGPNHASFMWGTSTWNSRIEWMWPNLGEFAIRDWCAFFFRLERRHLLQRTDKTHLWLLQFLFLPMINEDCREFQKMWNHHPISGKPKKETPIDMEFQGMIAHGMYRSVEHGPEYDAQAVRDFCNAAKQAERQAEAAFVLANRPTAVPDVDDNGEEPSHAAKPDKEHFEIPADQQAEDWGDKDAGFATVDDTLRAQATAKTDKNIHHRAVEAVEANCPFGATKMQEFRARLVRRLACGRVPTGYGIRSEELPNGYNPFESFPLGRSWKNEASRELRNEKWKPRAELWCITLDLMWQMVMES